MVINIQSRGFSLTNALRSFVEDRMVLSLARYGERISRLNVTLLDINGPRGGCDKRCRVTLKFDGHTPIVVQETHSDLYDAIVSCGSRLRRSAARKLDQARSRRNFSKPSLDVSGVRESESEARL